MDRVGSDGVDASAPGQRVEPGLADHKQVSTDVHRPVLTAGGERERERERWRDRERAGETEPERDRKRQTDRET